MATTPRITDAQLAAWAEQAERVFGHSNDKMLIEPERLLALVQEVQAARDEAIDPFAPPPKRICRLCGNPYKRVCFCMCRN